MSIFSYWFAASMTLSKLLFITFLLHGLVDEFHTRKTILPINRKHLKESLIKKIDSEVWSLDLLTDLSMSYGKW